MGKGIGADLLDVDEGDGVGMRILSRGLCTEIPCDESVPVLMVPDLPSAGDPLDRTERGASVKLR